MTIILLHGWGWQGQMWDQVRSNLTINEKIISPNLPGHGSVPWYPKNNETDWNKIISQFSEQFDQDGLILAGYSMGARVALGIKAILKNRVLGMVLIGVHPGLVSKTERKVRAQSDEKIASRLLEIGLDKFMGEWEQQPLFRTQSLLPKETQEWQKKVRLENHIEGLAWAMQHLGLGKMPFYSDTIDETIPMILVTGEYDNKFDEIAKETVKNNNDIKHISVKNAGHNVVLERPEEIASIIDDIVQTI